MQLVEQVLSNFKFDVVKKTMDFLEWKWVFRDGESKVPSIYEIIKFAEKEIWYILEKSYQHKEDMYISCGGFVINVKWYKDKCCIKLSFVLTGWSEWSEKLNENEVQKET